MAKTFRHAHDSLTAKRPDKAFRADQRKSQRAKDAQLTRQIIASPSLEARAVFSAR